jgi:plasmid stabilization system protein ParE
VTLRLRVSARAATEIERADVTSARISATRRLHLGRIRYFVYYRVKNDELAVLSVWHVSRATAPRA